MSNLLCAQEKNWALKMRHKNGQEVPQGDACEACFECHRDHFHHITWQQYCERMKGKDGKATEFQAFVEEALAFKNNPGKAEWKGDDVMNSKTVLLEVSKQYVGLTSNEVRKALKQDKVSKALLSSIPCITVITEEGSKPEQIYLFTDPHHPYRSVQLKSQQALQLQQNLLNSEQQTWRQQSQEVWRESLSVQRDGDGVASLLSSTSLMTLQAFLDKQAPPPQASLQGQEVKEEMAESENEGGELVGPAAQAKSLAGSSSLTRFPSSWSVSSSSKKSSSKSMSASQAVVTPAKTLVGGLGEVSDTQSMCGKALTEETSMQDPGHSRGKEALQIIWRTSEMPS